jgi:hypothetical protein
MGGFPEPNVMLRGGPSSLGPHERICHIENTAEKVKLRRGNRYEHFEPTAEIEQHLGRKLHIYVWTCCTYVAE